MTVVLVPCVCRRCGKEFSSYRSRIAAGRGLFCSQECRRAYVREGRQRETVCPRCGVTFAVRPHKIENGETPFCSHSCAKLGLPRSLADVHNDYVDRSGECWLWTGPTNSNGYGRMRFENKTEYAHRVAYTLAKGAPIPEGFNVLHSCDNPRCVRPDHLSLGTDRVNINQRDERDRVRHGDSHANAKLTSEKVRAIRAIYASTEEASYASIAKLYGVQRATIGDIIAGKTWKRVG